MAGDNNGNGENKAIDIGKQRWIVTPQFLWTLVTISSFLIYVSIQATLFLNRIGENFQALSDTVKASVMSYQKQNRSYQTYDANNSARRLCIEDWAAKNPGRALDFRCDRRVAILSGSDGDADAL